MSLKHLTRVDTFVRERWTARVVLGFVLLALATLVAVPVLVNQRVTGLRAAIQTSEPARTLVNQLQFNLMREAAALSNGPFGAPEGAAAAYREARATEDAVLDALADTVRQLGPEVVGQFAVVRDRVGQWHARPASDEANLDQLVGTARPTTARETEMFEQLLAETTELDGAILRYTMRTRQQIASAEQAGLRLSILLGLLALVAGAAATTLAGRVRRYASESDRRREEAEEALRETARVMEARQRMLRGVTHDVKNPIGAAMGFAQLLELQVRAPLLPEQAPLVAGVKRSLESALAIITDLLDLARADSGGLSVERLEVEVAMLARLAMEDQRAAAEAAGHTIVLEEPAEAHRVFTDPARVRQVLDNLLSNAVKYTPPPGQITVRVDEPTVENGPRPGAWIATRVIDNGPGIPPELREQIFEEFTRIDDSGTIRGHGLGLAIARRIARLLGGELELADAPPPGATFVFWLPLRQPAPDPPPPAS